ncbi:LOW QUALITY PROTEIN: hypothetical protein MSG28_013814 [Choristoneura fumiferana]|uniref:Uncharacterized protein n=1 Tax=Choristoneura fumiferana TaxID=7141 RepID=A0ACC0K8U6_CHOFU|nr:LOW QUALITY PROTEIN: hypothetical protein MSG28_013814 [Choristoneura fumiferana]
MSATGSTLTQQRQTDNSCHTDTKSGSPGQFTPDIRCQKYPKAHVACPQVERRGPPTDADKIHDEVKRLVMLCTCRQKFRVFQVGEGKYRKLRLVRILRSTVMVRVGGGWVALDEFLVKNDPCREISQSKCRVSTDFVYNFHSSSGSPLFRYARRASIVSRLRGFKSLSGWYRISTCITPIKFCCQREKSRILFSRGIGI